MIYILSIGMIFGLWKCFYYLQEDWKPCLIGFLIFYASALLLAHL